MTVRGILRWVLPWYASGEPTLVFDPDSIPPHRFAYVVRVPSHIVVDREDLRATVSKTVNIVEVS